MTLKMALGCVGAGGQGCCRLCFFTDVGSSAFGKKLLATHRVNILVISKFHAINVMDKQIYKNIDLA